MKNVAIIGAGPYGLSIAAHLRSLGVDYRIFGRPLDTWKKWATNVEGAPVDSGHFLTEENPDVTAKLLREFFLAD